MSAYTDIWLGLFSGIAFGFVIQRAGATDAHEMARAHLMREPRIPQFMVLVVAFSVLGLAGLQATGAGIVRVLPTSLVATGLGGVIFGIGWGLAGYCPGTTWAAVGEGRMDAVFALLGGLCGAAAFAQLHETLIPLLYTPTSLGPVTLADWLGGHTQAVWLLALALFAGAYAIGRVWGDDGE